MVHPVYQLSSSIETGRRTSGHPRDGTTTLLSDQTASPSSTLSPTRSRSHIRPFEETIYRFGAQEATTTAQKDQVNSSDKGLRLTSVSQPKRLETSMSLRRMADIPDYTCVYSISSTLCTPLLGSHPGASPVHKFRNMVSSDGEVSPFAPGLSVTLQSGPITSISLSKSETVQDSPGGYPVSTSCSAPFLGSLGILRPSVSSGDGPCMENMTLLCEVSLHGLSGGDCSF